MGWRRLGSLDSNQKFGHQKPTCCQLHHSPLAPPKVPPGCCGACLRRPWRGFFAAFDRGGTSAGAAPQRARRMTIDTAGIGSRRDNMTGTDA